MKKKYWALIILITFSLGGVGLFLYNKNEQERKEQEVMKMELTTAKQIKNTFADVIKIEFAEKYGENKLTGYTSVDVTLTTSYGVTSVIDADMSLKDTSEKLESYGVDPKLLEGVTETKVKLFFLIKQKGAYNGNGKGTKRFK